MPIYEFECTACGDSFERLQRLSDPDPSVCPVCGATKVKRRLTAPAFRLAGSGWYETDFKKDGDKKRNLVGKDEPPKSDAKTESGGEKKEKSAANTTPAASPAPKQSTDGAAKT
jgi:putative FmdB family regulatory protein